MTHDLRTLLLIAGMRDNRAREEVAAILAATPGVMDVDVNLIRSIALVRHDGRCGASELSLALEGAGYTAQERTDNHTSGPRHLTL